MTGYTCTKASKLGSMLGGFWGMAAGFVLGAIASGALAYVLNKMIYPGAFGYKKETIITFDCWFLPNFEYYFDLGNLLGVCIGGTGGGVAGAYAAGTAFALATV